MSNLNSRIAGLSPEKRALLERQLMQKRAAAPVQASIQPRTDPSVYPLSYAQQRLWFLSQLEPDNPFYNISAALRLKGSLDLTALQASFNTVLQRHEILRATFTTRQGEPVQVVAPRLDLNLEPVDLQGLSPEDQEREVNRLAAAEVAAPVSLSGDALIRASLLRLGTDEHVLLLTMHHIISDGWSLANFTREVSLLYRAYSNGEPNPLPPLTIQYFDYAQWQQDWLKGDVLQNQLNYWKTQLQSAPTVLELPTDRPRPPVQTYAGSRVSFHLSPQLYAGLQSLCRQQGITLFMLLLAAYQVLLYRYSGQDDLCVGTPAANRSRAEIEPLIGFFVNTLVLRADLSGAPAFRDFLQQVRERVLEAQNHADLPFDMLVEALQIPRDNAFNPLFQTLFNLQDAVSDPLHLPGIQAELLPVYTPAAKFDLVLTMDEGPQDLTGTIEYRTDLFNRETIERMAGHYATLLDGILADPSQPVSRLPLLTNAEKQQILVDWNNTTCPYPDASCIHHLIEAQARLNPDAPALFFQEQTLTYAEMNRRANRLAHWLHEQGVGPESIVGVYLERSFEMIIAILGVLKTGAAYMPMDPNYPAERLAYMLEDSHARLLLTHSALKARLPGVEIEHLCLDTDGSQFENRSSENPDWIASPDHLAYVIYTSGSTGKPKGTLLQHRGMVNFITANARFLGVNAHSRFLQFFSCGFDASVAEIFSALTGGAALYLITQETVLSGAGLARFIRDHQVTNAILPPSMLAVMPEQDLDCLQWLASGGEKVPPELAARWAPSRHFFNVYGPTECTVGPTIYEVKPGVELAANLPIGRPFPNLRLYILDPNQQPVPVGIPGELHIAGVCLARGYLNRPDLTAEKFVPDPFSALPGERMYRTGDRCCYAPDGNVIYLGRIDRQVKLRGFRVELGEIETALMQHPAVKTAAVMLRDDAGGQESQYLAAYLIARTSPIPSAAELRAFLRGRLPGYMVPTAFMFMEAFPLTPNAKLDWKAFPTPERTRDEVEFVAPRCELEAYLAARWKEVIRAGEMGVNDNYFELGGNSLQAAVITNRIQEETGEPVQVRAIFLSPTVAGLADYIRQNHSALAARFAGESQLAAGSAALAQPILPYTREAEIPLSFAQQRLWFLDQLEPDNPFYNISTAVRITGRLDAQVLEDSLNEIILRHEILRTTVVTRAGKGFQLIAPELTVAMQREDLSDFTTDRIEVEIARRVSAEAHHIFDLSRLPLLRMALLKISDDEHVAVLTMHHIISDGWSMKILIEELTAQYQARVSGQLTHLAPLAVQYADYSLWQRERHAAGDLEPQLAYWKQQLSGQSPLLELPLDHPRPAAQTYRGSSCSFALTGDLSRKVRALSQQEGVSLFMTLLAAFQTVLFRYTGQEDISIGTPVANRSRAEIDSLIGFFVNTLVLRTQLEGKLTFREALQRVRQTAVGAFSNPDVPFEMLVDEVQPDRKISHSPLFQVMIDMHDIEGQVLDLPGLTISNLNADTGTSKYDLVLNLTDTGSEIQGRLEFCLDLFEPETVRRMTGHLQTLLAAAAADPDLTLAAAPLLTAEEKQHILVDWNSRCMRYPEQGQTFHKLFEAQVERAPEALAAVLHDRRLTYRQLNQQANILAYKLQQQGVGPDCLVGICFERSVEMIVAIVATLKAGGCYVPLDPAYPRDRLDYMLSDAGIQVLLTQTSLQKEIQREGLQVICLDQPGALVEFEHLQNINPTSAAGSENLAYMIYTSGSTGRPKGTRLSHRAAIHLFNGLRAMIYQQLPPGPKRISLNAPLPFDASVQQLVRLMGGDTLYIVPKDIRADGAAMLKFIRDTRLEVLDCVPSQMKPVLAAGLLEDDGWKPLALLPGGEAIDEVTWHALASQPHTQVFNMYGPTECACDSTIGQVSRTPNRPVIGLPLPNVQLYILDTNLQPVPAGVAGELFIAGDGLGHGYHNRPELTTERFIPNPFSTDPGARLYRTGDLCRFLPDGNVEYLGRMDHQVKIRGFRIELGEIEAVLRAHPGVKDAAVLAREDTPGVKRLVAYLVAREEGTLCAGDLRPFLHERLPEYMLPAAYVFMTAFPLTPSGKMDRKALPAPDSSRPELENAFETAHTDKEQVLTEVWCSLLGLSKVGIHDNFFELGGDSILSIQVVARAKQAGLKITPRQLFEYPTIAGLAAVAEELNGSGFHQEPGTGLVPLTPIQHWFFDLDLPERHHWNQSVLLEVLSPLERGPLEQAFQALLEHHDALRARYTLTAEGWQQEIPAHGVPVALDWMDLSTVPMAELPTRIEQASAQAQAGLDLASGRLMRVVYFDCGAGRHSRLLIVIHHLVIDGVSWRILLEDFQNVYQQLLAGRDPVLPDKTTSFRAWAGSLTDYAKSSQALAELDAWRPPLGLRAALAFPADFDSPDRSETWTRTLETSLDSESTRLLLADVHSVYHTEMNDVLLAALALAFHHWSGRTSLWVDLEGHGREEILPDVDLSRTVGWFTSMYPVYLNTNGSSNPVQVLQSVRDTLRRVPNRGIGYGILRYLGDEQTRAKLAGLPAAQVSFNYFGQVEQGLNAGQIFQLARETGGSSLSPAGQRTHMLALNASVVGGQFILRCSFSTRFYRPETINDLLCQYRSALHQIIDDCTRPVMDFNFRGVEKHMDELEDMMDELENLLDDGDLL